MKRILALLLCFLLCVSLIPAASAEDPDEIFILEDEIPADEDGLIVLVDPEQDPPAEPAALTPPASGTCGEDLTWNLTAGGSLMISGTGDMYDYTYERAPWMDYESAASSGFHIQNISIDDGVTGVGNYAFDGLSHVTALALGSTIVRIGIAAFRGLGISTLTLPDGLVRIKMAAFEDCRSLFAVMIPASVTDIGSEAFAGCSVLSHFSVDADNTLYCAYDDVLFSKDRKFLVAFPEGKGNGAPGEGARDYAIPEGVTVIEGGAFRDNTSLCDISFPTGLREIGNNAFTGCSKLESVFLPDSVDWMGGYVFEGCVKLNYVKLSDNLTNLPRGLFKNCGNLSSAMLPDNLTTICYGAFEGCSALKNIYIPGQVQTIEVCAFKDTGLTRAELPDSVQNVMTQAFMGCRDLEYVIFGSGLEELGDWVVSDCSRLSRVYFKGDAPTFADLTFEGMALRTDPAYPMVLTAYYPADNSSWTAAVRQNYGGQITWKPFEGGLFIINQPQSATAEIGSTQYLSVRVRCVSEVVYQWQYKASGSTWKNVDFGTQEAPNFRFTVTSSMNNWGFRCVMTSGGTTLTSDAAWLTVDQTGAISLIREPADQTVAEGKTATFTTEAEGENLIYEWQYNTDPTDPSWRKCTGSGADTPELPVVGKTYRDGYQYRCRIYNAADTVYTRAAVLTVLAKPAITTQPKSVSAYEGDSAKFTVKASGSGLSYQWQYRTSSSGSWKNSTGADAKTKSLTVAAASFRSGYQYRCKVTNAAGTATSNAATLTVKAKVKPIIKTQPESTMHYPGFTAVFSVTATGGGLSYQWQFMNPSTGKWANCSDASATTSRLSVEVKTYRNGFQYRCKVSNEAGTTTSAAATLTVMEMEKPTIAQQPASANVEIGQLATFMVVASGINMSYQWYYRAKPENDWAKCTDGTGSILHVVGVAYRNGYQYRCAVKNAGGTTYTKTVTLTVNPIPKPVITQQPVSVTVSAGSEANFFVEASGKSPLEYQWYYRAKPENDWAKCSNGRWPKLNLEAKGYRNGYQYYCAVTNEGGTTKSNVVTLTVTGFVKPVILEQPKDVTASAGSQAFFSVTVSSPLLESYQWYYRANPSNAWAKCTNGTSAWLTVEAKNYRNGYQYRCAVTNEAGTTYSDYATLTVTSADRLGLTLRP
ncbi:MAG: leucine-rich repeat protein [Oscillospiraceae bacterium]|nr:leucine-rich repeat protein [Oscillospiraceae bacterium]